MLQAGQPVREYLLLDLQLPGFANPEHTREALQRCEKLLRDVAGVREVLALTENPFDVIIRSQPCILVRLAPADQGKDKRDEITQIIRTKLEKVPDMTLRVRDLSRRGGLSGFGYPIELAVSGPEADKVRNLARSLLSDYGRAGNSRMFG